MKKLSTILILSFSTAYATVIPVENPLRLVEDELLSYQWGLLNQGQTLVREKDDIHNMLLLGIPGKDIGWKSLVGKVTPKRPVVAVLDSGVDLTHPELQGNLWKNEGECGKDPKVDNDGNQLKGDCDGWNFTEEINSDAAKDPSDNDGHGTHIAGIIAAAQNSFGMVGVIPNALIMPIKVMKDSNSKSDVPSSTAFALGIRYAVDNGADVINMSLGWPQALETKALRDAVFYALGQGVPIVAAAGNNNSSSPLYPCAYDGVICVGATSIDGTFASFSNFGGHVDTLAPGEGILGLHPSVFEPEFFPVPGFELRSGTSQSAPMVSGLIATLKARQPDIKIDEIFARLYQANIVKDKTKSIMGGEATWDTLTQEVSRPVIRPVFKKLRQIVFRGDNPATKIPLTIRNFGVEASDIKVKVETLSNALEVTSQEILIPGLKQGEFKELFFDLKLKDQNAESDVSIKVSIETQNEIRSFINEVPVVRDLRQDSKFQKSNFLFTDKPLPVGSIRESGILPLISTVDSYGPSPKHEFFMKKTMKEEKKIEITLLSLQGKTYVQNKNLVVLENALALVNFIRVDVNFDGKEDYVFQTLCEKDQKKYFSYAFYDENFKTLWNEFQHVRLDLDLFVESLNDLAFMKMDHPALGKILVPAYFTVGMLPKIDQPITSWERFDGSRKKRLYYLEPKGTEFRLRSVTTKVWEESLKKKLNSKWFETVEVEQVLPPSPGDISQGELRALISTGLGTRRELFIHRFSPQTQSSGSKIPQLVLQADSVDPLLEITDKGLVMNGEVFFNIYDRTRARLVVTRELGQIGEYVLRHETKSDLIAGHIASFESSGQRVSVYQSREELIAITTGKGTEKRSSRAKLRYSFLSQKLLSEMYYPVSYLRDGKRRAAFYVDATSVTGNRVYLYEDQMGDLVSSIRNSLILPPNCRPLNPRFSESSGTHEFVFLCLEEKEFFIRSYEMN
jgi:cell wall-associated protease